MRKTKLRGLLFRAMASLPFAGQEQDFMARADWMYKAFAIGLALGRAALLFAALLLIDLHIKARQPLTDLDRVLDTGVLRVAIKNGPTTYYQGAHGPTGFEYSMALEFARMLKVDLQVIPVDNFSQIRAVLESGVADFAASGISRTQQRESQFAFGPAYEQVTETAVYRSGTFRPRTVADLERRRLAVVPDTSYEDALKTLKTQYPALQWQAPPGIGIEDLFQQISDGQLDHTIVDDQVLAVHRRYFPSIRPAFALPDATADLAWAFPRQGHTVLLQSCFEFFSRLKRSGDLQRLRERYFAHVQDYNFVGSLTFFRHVRNRLPGLKPYFQQAAEVTGIDWRLLAAVGYQESHWDADAVSPTGVRGIMMLTRDAASDMGVSNRLDPEQSISGGAKYLQATMSRMPDRIDEEDRTWLGLGAYNVGFGHLEDARILTQRQSADPDRWLDVKKRLPLLANQRWYQHTRHGYARGWEPVRYVENIRGYYEILLWLTQHPQRVVSPIHDGNSAPIAMSPVPAAGSVPNSVHGSR